jgi:enoyl-CoA hydratase/carnithine racemase
METEADGALRLTREAGVAVLTLNRPEQRNALNSSMWAALPGLLSRLASDPSMRVLIVRGAGGHFASGADISEFPIIFRDRPSALAYGGLLNAATDALAAWPGPVIAQIEGYCIGAGLAIALACDLRIAASDARLGAPPAKLGLIYSLGDTRRLMDAVGPAAAKAMLFTGVLHPAPEALRLGLVDELHAGTDLASAVAAKARTMAGLSSWSIRHAKALVGKVLAGARQETDETRGWFADAVEGPDFAEGLAAFNEKRPPSFP